MENLWQEWWAWAAGGLVLAIVEVLLPTGYILLGFAAGAILTGVLIALSVTGAELPMTLLVWGILSGISWGALRALFGRPQGQQKKIVRHDINDTHPPSP